MELVLSDSPADIAGDDLDVGLFTEGPSDTTMIGRHLLPRVRVLLDFLVEALVD